MLVTEANNYADGQGKNPTPAPAVITRTPYTTGYLWDRAWYTARLQNKGILTASRAELERYYKYLPPLTRGIAVPNWYPLLKAGADGALTNTYPRIVSFSDTTPATSKFTWTNPNATAAWTSAILTAYPGLKKIPKSVSLTFGAMLKDKDTKVALTDNLGAPTGWYNKRLNVYFTVEPHVLFDSLFHAGKIFADPSATYWQQTYSAWLSLDFFESLRNLAEALLLAIGAAYAAAAIVGQSAAGSGALEGTSLSAPADTSAALPTVTGTSTVTSTGLESVAAPAAAESTAAAAGGSTLESVAGGAAAVNAATGGALGSAVKGLIGGAIGAITGKPATPAAKSATAKTAATAAPSPMLTYIAIGAGLLTLVGLVAVAGG